MRNCADCGKNIDHLYCNMRRCKECAHARELKRKNAALRAKRKNPGKTHKVNPHPFPHNRVEAGVYESVQLLKMNPSRWGPRELAMRYDIPLEAIETGMEL